MNMHYLIETPELFNELNLKVTQCLEQALKDAPAREECFVVKSGEDIAKICADQSAFFLLQEGSVKMFQNGQLFAILEKNDLIGLDHQINREEIKLEIDMAVKLKVFNRSDLSNFFHSHSSNAEAWQSFLEQQISLYFLLATSFSQAGMETETEIEKFSEGDVIIEQGTEGKAVYHLLEGSADVLVDGVKVGEVRTEEIFGALAALTSSARSASVKATSDSMVVKIPNNQFLSLIKTKPATVLTLMQDMARAMSNLNAKVVDLSKLNG